jgi:hypothetical protein
MACRCRRAAHVVLVFFQEAALAEVRRAAEELQKKKQEVESAQKELTHAQDEKNRAGKDIDVAAKIMTGDDAVVAKLAEALQKDGYAYVDNFLGEPLATYIQQEVIRACTYMLCFYACMMRGLKLVRFAVLSCFIREK